MNRSAKGAVRIAGRDILLPRKKPRIADDVPSLSPPPKEAYYVFALEGPVGRLICPVKCELVRIVAWMESANNLKLSVNEEDMYEFSISIPVIRGKQLIERKPFEFRELHQLDTVTFSVTKPTGFYLSAVFREL